MNGKIQKYLFEKEKNKAKIAELQSRNRELDRLITEIENTNILGLVEAEKLTYEQLQTIIKAFHEKSGAPFTMPKQEENNDEE